MDATQITRKLETIRADLSNAGAAHEPTDRINDLSIALELLTDLVEHLIATEHATSMRISAIGRSLRAMRGDGRDG
jgi:hypothetical protein